MAPSKSSKGARIPPKCPCCGQLPTVSAITRFQWGHWCVSAEAQIWWGVKSDGVLILGYSLEAVSVR